MKSGLKIAGAAVGVVLLVIGIWFGVTQFQRATADYRGETEQIEQTEANERFRIQAYDSFFDQCAAVQGAEARIAALEEELEAGVSASREEQIRASITAVRSQRAEMIAQYNADAAKDWTVGQFQANNLPHRLDVNQEATTCAL